MRRWVPFAIAIFMLTPFALWLGLALLGPGGGTIRIQSGVGTALLAASLPLAGLFWVQNLRQLGDSMGTPSRLRIAARLAALLPAAILVIGGIGTAWLLAKGGDYLEPFLCLAGTLVMTVFAWLIARAPVEPGHIEQAEDSGADDERMTRAILLFIGNVAMALALLAYYWTPFVLLWAVFALVPVAFVALIGLSWWAAQSGVVDRAPTLAAGEAANDRAGRTARAA